MLFCAVTCCTDLEPKSNRLYPVAQVRGLVNMHSIMFAQWWNCPTAHFSHVSPSSSGAWLYTIFQSYLGFCLSFPTLSEWPLSSFVVELGLFVSVCIPFCVSLYYIPVGFSYLSIGGSMWNIIMVFQVRTSPKDKTQKSAFLFSPTLFPFALYFHYSPLSPPPPSNQSLWILVYPSCIFFPQIRREVHFLTFSFLYIKDSLTWMCCFALHFFLPNSKILIIFKYEKECQHYIHCTWRNPTKKFTSKNAHETRRQRDPCPSDC